MTKIVKMSASSGGKIVSHGKIYLAGNILQRCVSFVMLPIYTRFLTPADYGTIELLSMVLDFVGIVLGLRIGQAIFRFYAEYDNQKDKREIITTAIYLVFLLNVIGVLLLFLTGDLISTAVFADINQKRNLLLFSLTLLMQAFIAIPMVYLRAKERPMLFIAVSITKLILQLSMNVIFVVWLHMQVEGVIYSAVISSALIALVLVAFVIKDCGVSFSVPKAKKLISFSLPLMLTGMISFYITFGDRYFLRLYNGLDDVGVYALAYKFGFLLMFLVVNPFSAIWDFEKYKVAKADNARKMFGDIFIYYSTVVILVGIILSLFVKDILHIMASPPFWGAAKIVPIVLAAYVTNAWCEYVNFGILLKNKTIEITFGTLLSGCVITAGYLYLIPKFGAIGAAWATLVAFGTRAVWVYFRAKRLFDLGIKWRYSFVLCVIWAGAYGLSRIGENINLGMSILWNSALVSIVLGIIVFSPLLPIGVRSQLRYALRHPNVLLSFK